MPHSNDPVIHISIPKSNSADGTNNNLNSPSDLNLKRKRKKKTDLAYHLSKSQSLESLHSSSPSILTSSSSSSSSFASFFSETHFSSTSLSTQEANSTSATSSRSRLFSDQDEFLGKFSCALHKEILLPGKLYVATNYLFFKPSVFGRKKLHIPISEILAIEKRSTAMVFPNAIEVVTQEKKYFFGSFLFREKAYQLISACVSKAQVDRVEKRVSEGHSDFHRTNSSPSASFPPASLVTAPPVPSLTFPRSHPKSILITDTNIEENAASLPRPNVSFTSHGDSERCQDNPNPPSTTSGVQIEAPLQLLTPECVEFEEAISGTSAATATLSDSSSRTVTRNVSMATLTLSSNPTLPNSDASNTPYTPSSSLSPFFSEVPSKRLRKHHPHHVFETYWPVQLHEALWFVFQVPPPPPVRTWTGSFPWWPRAPPELPKLDVPALMKYAHWQASPWQAGARTVQYTVPSSRWVRKPLVVQMRETCVSFHKDKVVHEAQLRFPSFTKKGHRDTVSMVVSLSTHRSTLVHVCVSAAVQSEKTPLTAASASSSFETFVFRLLKSHWTRLSKGVVRHVACPLAQRGQVGDTKRASFAFLWMQWSTVLLFVVTLIGLSWLAFRLYSFTQRLEAMYVSRFYLRHSIAQSLEHAQRLLKPFETETP